NEGAARSCELRNPDTEMPMYYFYLHVNDDVVDADGTELPDLASAHEHARQVARELTFKRTGMLEGWKQWTMSVRDDNGEVLLSFQLSEVEVDSRPTGGRHQPTVGTKKSP